MEMKALAFSAVLRVVLPPILGALGALAATAFPAYCEAVCRAGGL